MKNRAFFISALIFIIFLVLIVIIFMIYHNRSKYEYNDINENNITDLSDDIYENNTGNSIEGENSIIENDISNGIEETTINNQESKTQIEESNTYRNTNSSNKNNSTGKIGNSIIKDTSNIVNETVEQKKDDSISNSTKQTNNETQKQSTTQEQTIKLDLEKYDRYEKALNGGYKCFKKNQSEISKLRNLINESIEKFGYTNVKVVEDSSIISSRYFTTNKINVENAVYNSEDFTIYYYAETEYSLTAEGVESMFQVRSYIKVK